MNTSEQPSRPGTEAPRSVSTNLLARLQAEEDDAWRRLATLYGPLVFHWGRAAGLQPPDVEDVVQEVFRTVAARVKDFRRDRESHTFRGWLWTITRNKIGDAYRRQQQSPAGQGGSDAQLRMAQVPAPADGEPVGTGALYDRAMQLIQGEFAESTWQAFEQVVIEDRPPADVAAELRMSLNAVYLAKSRILKRLREELGDEEN